MQWVPQMKQVMYDAYKWLETAQQTKEIENIKDGPEILQKLMNVCFAIKRRL